jgi:pimeloyl-ACP methyl ester carboxylesterase
MTHATTAVTELEIKLPWGTIAAQEWKTPQWKKQILMLHGWQDNSNSFKRLVPLLPNDWWTVAIDFPGHGFSSHRVEGLPYHGTDYVIDVKAAIACSYEELSYIQDRPFSGPTLKTQAI